MKTTAENVMGDMTTQLETGPAILQNQTTT
jgi:hypothetical protein